MKKHLFLLTFMPAFLVASLTSCGGKHPDDPVVDEIQPLCFTALNNNSPICGCFAVGEDGKTPAHLPTLYYYIGNEPSKNPKDWKEFVLNNPEYSSQLKEGYQVIATLNQDEKIYFIGNNPEGINGIKESSDPDDADIYWHFGTAKYEKGNEHGFNISGNIMSLINYKEKITKIPNAYCFSYLFGNRIYGGPQFVDASGLQLGDKSIKLTEGCYYKLFYNDQYLTKAPIDLPAEELTESCYYGMFCNCYSLKEAPKALPAHKLAVSCYEQMFLNCFYSLATAPILPAMNSELAANCYKNMFNGCHMLSRLDVEFGESGQNKWPGKDDSEYTENWLSGAGTQTADHIAHFNWKGEGAPTDRNVNTVPGDSSSCTWKINDQE